MPAAWSSEVSNFTCASFGGGTPCQLTLRYAPTQATSQSSFKVGYSYVDSAGRAQSDAISIGYSAVAPNSARVAIGGVNLASATLIAVNPGESQDVSFTFTSSDGNALGNLQLAQGASLPAGWTSDAALSTFSCAEVTQDGKCQLILHFKPTDQAQGRQTLALDYTYRNAVGQSMSGSASIGYTSKIYRLYAAGTQTSLGVSQCWLKMAPGVGRYNLDACDDPGADVPNPNSPPPSIQRIVISGSNAYLLDISTYVIKVCSVDVDGALFDCQAKIAAPANTSSISVMGDALYALVEKSTGTSLYACPLSLEAGCEPVTVNFSNNVAGIFLHMTGDGGALFLVDSLQMVQRCSRFESGGFNLQCEAWPTMAGGLISSLTAGQFAASSYVFLGINDFSKGPEFSKCSATSPQCTYMTFINNSFPSGGNAFPLTLIDMSFANIDSTNPALYLLVTDLINQKRGIVRCTLVTTQTSSSPIDIADQLTCGAYTGIDGSTISAPISIAIR